MGWGFENHVREPPKSFFFFFFFTTTLVAAAAAELSYVKKHLDVYDSKMIFMFDSKMSVLIVCLNAYTILATMKSLILT